MSAFAFGCRKLSSRYRPIGDVQAGPGRARKPSFVQLIKRPFAADPEWLIMIARQWQLVK
jgi:hypothetical protein